MLAFDALKLNILLAIGLAGSGALMLVVLGTVAATSGYDGGAGWTLPACDCAVAAPAAATDVTAGALDSDKPALPLAAVVNVNGDVNLKPPVTDDVDTEAGCARLAVCAGTDVTDPVTSVDVAVLTTPPAPAVAVTLTLSGVVDDDVTVVVLLVTLAVALLDKVGDSLVQCFLYITGVSVQRVLQPEKLCRFEAL